MRDKFIVMKNFKLNFIIPFIVLGIILAISSCTPDQSELLIENDVAEMQNTDQKAPVGFELEKNVEFVLPVGVKLTTEEETETFMASLTAERMDELVEHTRIAEFLQSIGKVDAVVDKLQNGETLSKDKLASSLSRTQLNSLDNFQVSQEADSRWCGPWGYTYYYWQNIYVNGWCQWHRKVGRQNRSCSWWDGPKYRFVYVGPYKPCWQWY